ncbi:MAG TPA: NAD(P)H-binding protein [Thermoanaerobaculia bacterium]
MGETRQVFVTGGTGYLGGALLPALLARGHRVRALARPGSEAKLPLGCGAVAGNALDAATFAGRVSPADTLVHLVGVSHPAPWKAEQFRTVDLASARASVEAARAAGVRHLVYLSVAQPAPAMRAYVAARAEAEALISGTGLNATFVRPWYVLGPGHRWPYALIPMYALFERLPTTRDAARRLGLVTLRQMVDALVWAVENSADGVRVMDVEAIRAGSL